MPHDPSECFASIKIPRAPWLDVKCTRNPNHWPETDHESMAAFPVGLSGASSKEDPYVTVSVLGMDDSPRARVYLSWKQDPHPSTDVPPLKPENTTGARWSDIAACMRDGEHQISQRHPADDCPMNSPAIAALVNHFTGAVLRMPTEWERELGVRVIDADGWAGSDFKTWGEKITREEFERRAAESTVEQVAAKESGA